MPANRIKLEQVARDLLPAGADLTHLGTGGFASTFRVDGDGASYALKIVDPERMEVARFERELGALQRVTHPNVVRFLAHGTHQFEGVDYGFIRMEFVAAQSLWDAILGGRSFSFHEAAELLLSIVRGAQAIWEQGTAHRDLSPRNVLVRADGTAVIVDLGLARHVDDNTTTLPTPGTPGWMSPEQVEAGAFSHGNWKSDQYVIGLLGHLMLTGKPVFGGVGAWAAPGYQDVPTIRGAVAGTPTVLADLIDKMTARAPARRFQKPSTLMLELERAVTEIRLGEAQTEGSPYFIPVVKHFSGYATTAFIQSLQAREVVVGMRQKNVMSTVFGGVRGAGGLGVIDPDTHRMRSPEDVRGRFTGLSYGGGPALRSFASDTARRDWVNLVLDEHQSEMPDVMIAPYFWAGPSEQHWVEETLRCYEVFTDLVQERGLDGFTSVRGAVAVDQEWLKSPSERDRLLNMLTDAELQSLYLLVGTEQASFAPLSDAETIRGMEDVFGVLREAGVPVIVGQRASSGLLMLTLGAAAWSGGVSANLLNMSAPQQTKEQRRRGQPRLYVPQLLNFVPTPTYVLMRAEDDERVRLETPEGRQLVAEAGNFDNLTTEQTVLLFQHNIRAMKAHADQLSTLTSPQRRAQMRLWIAEAVANYRALEHGKRPAFLDAWASVLA